MALAALLVAACNEGQLPAGAGPDMRRPGPDLAGVDLTRRVRQKEVFGLTFPLLTTASGAKMGKTAAGALWMDPRLTTPFDFFQYFVNVDDSDVVRFLKLLTFEPLEEIARFETVEGAELRDAKRLLARAVTAIVHGAEAAEAADAQARAAFGGGSSGGAGATAALPTSVLDRARVAAGLKLVDVIAESGLAASKSAARRLIEQGGVRVGERKVTSVDDPVQADELGADGVLLHVGKKHIRRLVLGPA